MTDFHRRCCTLFSHLLRNSHVLPPLFSVCLFSAALTFTQIIIFTSPLFQSSSSHLGPTSTTWMRFSLPSASSLALSFFYDLFCLSHSCHKGGFQAREGLSPQHVIYIQNAGMRAIKKSQGGICGRYSKRRYQSLKLVSLINQKAIWSQFHLIFFLMCEFEVI